MQLHRRALDDVKDRVAANECVQLSVSIHKSITCWHCGTHLCIIFVVRFDKQRPLALVAFSNSSRSLDALAGAFATALFADTGRQDGVRVLDLASLVPSVVDTSTNHDVKRQLRTALASLLTACPQRSLLVVENPQVLNDATLPVLDVFLDPLNGERAQLQLPDTDTGTGRGQLLDASSTVFLFLYKVDSAAFYDATVPTWRDFLMAAWTRKEGLVEEFTPQAFVGRLTDGIELFASDEDAGGELSPQCRAHKRQPQSPATGGDGSSGWDDVVKVAFGLVLVFALLYCVKLWTKEVAVKRARRGPIKPKKKAAKRGGSSAKRAKRK